MSRKHSSFLRAVALAAALVLAAAGQSLAQIDILSGKPLVPLGPGAPGLGGGPESVVTVSADFMVAGPGRPAMLSITADIEPPWYTYAITQKPILATPTEIKVDPSPDYRVVGEFRPNLPPEIVRKDRETFEIHAPSVTWQAPLEIKPGVDPRNLKITGSARIQVCNDQSCLNPTRFDFTAHLAAGQMAPVTRAKPTGVHAPAGVHARLRGYLEPAVAVPGSTVNLVVTAEPAKDWHIYELTDRDVPGLGYKPTLIVPTSTSGFRTQRTTATEKAIESPSIVPGGPPQRYHSGNLTWTTPIVIPKDTKAGPYPIEGLIGYQTCSGATCDLPTAARFAGIVTVGSATEKGTVPLAFSEARYIDAAKAAAARPVVVDSIAQSAAAPDALELLIMIAFSLGGGLLLNFMPCVLPVIGLKILSFAEQAGRSRAQTLALNIWYSLGTLIVFMVLAALSTAVNLGLREQNLGWGEQFNSTTFNVVMVAIVFVFALSFLGVWEIPIPGFVGSGAAAHAAAKEGAFGAFAKGALTTVLATPCSGPALGPVFGYTLNQPPAITFLIFGCIGLGMAFPYLVIGAFPRLIGWLPKPGAWMDTFKQMMGFMMLGTIVFFFSFMKQDYLVATFAMMIGLWAGCWWIGRVSLVEPLARKLRAWAQGAAFAGLIGWAAFAWLTPRESIIPWQSFSRAELAKLNAEGKTVLVDFTAKWCANCKANLFFAIETADVRDRLAKDNVVPMLADWSDESPEVTSMLNSLNRQGIPLLAVFPPGGKDAPILLDGLLTKGQVLDALKQAGPSKAAGGGKALTASTP